MIASAGEEVSSLTLMFEVLLVEKGDECWMSLAVVTGHLHVIVTCRRCVRGTPSSLPLEKCSGALVAPAAMRASTCISSTATAS